MNDIYVVYFWPEDYDSPDTICAVTSEADAQEMMLSLWQSAAYDAYLRCFATGLYWEPEDFSSDSEYMYDFGYYQTHVLH